MRLTFRMLPIWLLFLSASSPLIAVPPELNDWLRFEAGAQDTVPLGWIGGPPGTLFFDAETVKAGEGAARVERSAESPGRFSSLSGGIDIDFSGEVIEFRGYLKTRDVEGFAGLWLRLDSGTRVVQFDNMQNVGLNGDSPWTEYSIQLPLDLKADTMSFGVLLGGTGAVWADELRFFVDGKPIEEAPERVREKTVLDLDTEFHGGSKLDFASVDQDRAETLALVARLWGFLKYHHPRVAGGEMHWDFELFRVLPGVLAAQGTAARDERLLAWLEKLGEPEPCGPCAEAAKEPYFEARLQWIEDLSPPLRTRLETVHQRRFQGGDRFFVSPSIVVGNPDFSRELDYSHLAEPDVGYRLLGLFRLWNIIEYYFPYRDLMDADWSTALAEAIPRVVAAETKDEFQLEMLRFIVKIDDGHANLWSAGGLRPPVGECQLPVSVRFIEDKAAVVQLALGTEPAQSPLQVGDVILGIGGEDVASLVQAWMPFYPGSNPSARRAGMMGTLTRGACGPVSLDIDRGGERIKIKGQRLAEVGSTRYAHDRPGEVFQRLSDDIAYLKLTGVKNADVDQYLEGAAGSRGLVIDIRNYPTNFMVFALGQRLVEESTPFATFTVADEGNPGAFVWKEALTLEPVKPGYAGKVAILVDEASVSHSEYTAMAFRAGPWAVVVGGVTAGADGNVSRISLPGGLQTAISGIGIFYPDRSPTQRLGIVPDIPAEPTLEGLRSGRDEVLEAAIRHLLGPEAPEADIRDLALRPAVPKP